jgi:hypothetical protein
MPVVFFAFLRILLLDFVSSFNPFQVCVNVIQTFSFWYLCHCEKCRGFWFICWNLALLGVCYLILSCIIIFLNEINLWAIFLKSSVLIVFLLVHLLNFENKSFVDLFGWYNLDNECVLTHLLRLLKSICVLSKFIFFGSLKWCASYSLYD